MHMKLDGRMVEVYAPARSLLSRLRNRVRQLLCLAGVLVLIAPALVGCTQTIKAGSSIATTAESPAVKAKRLLLVAYDTHTATSNSIKHAVTIGACSKQTGATLADDMDKAKSMLDTSKQLIALGQATEALANIDQAEVVMRVVLRALESR